MIYGIFLKTGQPLAFFDNLMAAERSIIESYKDEALAAIHKYDFDNPQQIKLPNGALIEIRAILPHSEWKKI